MSGNVAGFGATLMLGKRRGSQHVHREACYSPVVSLVTKELCPLSLQICQTKISSEKINRARALACDLAYIC